MPSCWVKGVVIRAGGIACNRFDSGQVIPVKYSCNGSDVSPPLSWTNPPDSTVSYALIVADPDAPSGTFYHWLVFNIPSTTTSFAENASAGGTLPAGCLEGVNGFSALNYKGPCPPIGTTHRYYFNLYALDINLSLNSGATASQIYSAMDGHILEEVSLMGLFSR